MRKARIALRVLGVAAAILAAAVAVLLLCLGPIVKAVVKNVAPRVLGVPVTVDGVSASAFRGRIEIRGFEIGNPDGFATPYLLHADRVLADLRIRELLSGRCHFQEIMVLGPRVWYHRKLASSNLSTLLDGLDNRTSEEKKNLDKSRDKRKKGGGKSSVVIDHFLFDDGVVGIKMGAGVEVPLAKVELKDIGKDGSFMAVQIVRVVFGAVFDSVFHAVTAVGGAAVDAAGAAVDAVGNAADALGAAAGAAAGAVGNAAGALIDGAKSLLGGD